MDHTLLDDQSELPENMEQILNLCSEKDIRFVAASGRTLHSIETKFGSLSDKITIISDNGTLLKHNGTMLYEGRVSPEDTLFAINAAKNATEYSIIITGLKKVYVETKYESHQHFLEEYYQNLEFVDDVSLYADDAIKITLLSLEHNEENYETLCDCKFPSSLSVFKSGKVWIDIIRSDVSKGVTLTKLLNHLNISSDNAAAFGDYDNDIEMLKAVKYSYAVSNAADSVKEVASEIIGSNNEQAVINTILKLIQ